MGAFSEPTLTQALYRHVWRRQQPARMFTPRLLFFRIVFHVFEAGYRAIVSYCFYVIPEHVMEFDKTAVN